MFGFSKKEETSKSVYEPTEEEYQNYMTGFRLGFPVETDKPARHFIDSNEPLFRRGLTDGMRVYQENKEFLVEHPELNPLNESDNEGQPIQSRGGFFGLFSR